MSHRELQDALDDAVRRVKARRDADEGTRCVECDRPIDETSGRWYSNGMGELVPFCTRCAEREFPLV